MYVGAGSSALISSDEENVQEADALALKLSEEAGVDIQLRYLKSGFVFQVAREDDAPNLLGGKLGNRVCRALTELV